MASVSAAPRPKSLRAARARKQAVFRWVVVSLVLIFFLVPMASMLDFSTRLLSGARSGKAWATLFDMGMLSTNPKYIVLWDGLKASGLLVVLTLVIMVLLLVPTMTWVRLRLPKLIRPIEFICLLPLTIPAVVLVVGLAPIYRTLSQLLSTSAIWLCFAYVVLVLPYAYRALDAGLAAIDVKTLSEAARSLGASWAAVMVKVILPSIRTAIVSACFLSIALVLGEFTIASLLSRNNLQTAINLVSQSDARLAVAISLLALFGAFLLLVVLSLLDRKSSDRTKR